MLSRYKGSCSSIDPNSNAIYTIYQGNNRVLRFDNRTSLNPNTPITFAFGLPSREPAPLLPRLDYTFLLISDLLNSTIDLLHLGIADNTSIVPIQFFLNSSLLLIRKQQHLGFGIGDSFFFFLLPL